jgi:hypothetical protein
VFTHDRAHESLDRTECRRLLGSEHVGRIALSVAALPAVVPVLYRLAGDRVVFAVEPDTLYDALCDNVAAFEVDHVDGDTNEGWTVLVVGRCRPCALSLPGFDLPGARTFSRHDRLIAIDIDRLTGLRTRARPAAVPVPALQAPV